MRNKLLILLTLILFVSCKTTYIPVEVPKVHTEYITRNDTTIFRDSVYVDRYLSGDTVRLTEFRYKEILKVKTDTIIKCDSIPYIKEVEVEKEIVPSYYKKINKLFWVLITLILLYLGGRIYKITRRL